MTQNAAERRVLITGARLPVALEIARALKAAGAKVWAGDSVRLTPAGASCAVEGALLFPSPVLDFAGFRAAVSAFVKERGITLLVPCSEEIFFLAKTEDALAPARLFAPPLSFLRGLHSKVEALKLAEGCGALIPRTIRVASEAELREACREIPGAILKPEFSRGAYELRSDGKGVEPSAQRPWLVQEKLRGRELSVCCVVGEGKVLTHAVYEPLYRAGGGAGASLYFRPVESPPALSFLEAFARKYAGVSAQLSFDVMERADGSLALIECNPRPTSGAQLFPAGFGGAYFGGSVKPAPATRPRAAKLAVLLLNFFPSLSKGRLGTLLRDLLRARDSCFSWRDPLPAQALQFSALEILWRARRWPVPARHAYTWDLEWNGEVP